MIFTFQAERQIIEMPFNAKQYFSSFYSSLAHAIMGLTFLATRYATSLNPKRGQKRDARKFGLIQLV
jgi:hypothetical protein